MRGPLSQHSTAAPRPRHNIPFIHAERCLRKMLSLCPLIKYCMLTGEKRRTFFWLASALTFQLRVYLCSHSQSVLFVTCWQYSQQRGGILNDSLKQESILAPNAGMTVWYKNNKCLIRGSIKPRCLLMNYTLHEDVILCQLRCPGVFQSTCEVI